VDISPLLAPGVAKAFESCAVYDEIQTPQGPVDRGGCLNLLTPQRTMSKTSDGIAPNSCLVEVSKWNRVVLEAA
jgi:trimethylamine-N-oxide reductase (cytochrome c)